MAFTMNTYFLRTPTGLLKILELIFVVICLILARIGKDGDPLDFGSAHNDFLGRGTVVGYCIIVPAILLTYLFGANLTILELSINLIGGILFISTGAVCIQQYEHRSYYHTIGMALGSMCIVTGIIFLIDFLVAIKNTRVTVYHTTRTI